MVVICDGTENMMDEQTYTHTYIYIHSPAIHGSRGWRRGPAAGSGSECMCVCIYVCVYVCVYRCHEGGALLVRWSYGDGYLVMVIRCAIVRRTHTHTQIYTHTHTHLNALQGVGIHQLAKYRHEKVHLRGHTYTHIYAHTHI